MKTISKAILTSGLLVLSTGANAALVDGSTLLIETGSTFELEVSPGFFLPTSLIGLDGVRLGTIQLTGIDTWSYVGASGFHFTTSPTNVLSSSGQYRSGEFQRLGP